MIFQLPFQGVMMKKFSLILTFLFLSLTFVSCGGSSGGGGSDQQREEDEGNTGGFTYDSELSGEERLALEESTQKIATLDVQGSRVKGFSQVFGGNLSSNVVAYMQKRVNYFISAATDYRTRLVPAPLAENAFDFYGSNPSVFIWYDSKTSGPEGLRFQTNGQEVVITSSRIGVMQVGNIYTQSDTITQALTLVHEARHSDCKGGALASDLDNWSVGGPIENLQCGHLHGECPPGHPYAGIVACDLGPWGAYAVDYIYSLAISQACSSCSETEKQQALANGFEVRQRTIYDFEDTRNGAYGPADMSSSNQVR